MAEEGTKTTLLEGTENARAEDAAEAKAKQAAALLNDHQGDPSAMHVSCLSHKFNPRYFGGFGECSDF